MSAAEDVVHKKAILISDCADTTFIGLLRSWMQDEATRYPNTSDPVYSASDSAAAEAAEMASVLRGADNYWISKPMCDLARHASTTMPDEPLLRPDLPSTTGWMVFADPFRMIDIRSRVLTVNAVSWASQGDQIKVWSWVDKNDVTDSVNLRFRNELSAEEWQRIPLLTLNHVFPLRYDEMLPRGLSWDMVLPPDATVDVRETQLPDGSWTLQVATDQALDLSESAHVTRSPFAAYLLCIWRFCQQSIAARNPEEVGRTTRRRLGRMAIPDKPVSIITLRRIDEPYQSDGESHVEWQHRWWVRGHWRNQPYKEDGETIHRQIYIHPFIKGPEGKPMLTRPKINALVR